MTDQTGNAMTRHLPGVLALALLLLLSASSCILVAGAGAGYIISREVSDDEVYSVEVRQDVDHVWATARESLEILHDLNTELNFTASPRVGTATVDKALVTVEVLAIDLDRTRVRIKAERPLLGDDHTAEMVQRHILDRL